MANGKSLIIISAVLACTGAFAQTPYMNAELSSQDVIGDARYVGMGGAMGALGANLSAMSSNPAGIGLYRRSDASLSFSVLTQNNKPDLNEDMTHMSFDQMGFVFNAPIGGEHVKYFNFAVNYQKKVNFNNSFIADNSALNGLSQTQEMADLWNNTSYTTPLADLMYQSCLINPVYTDEEGNYSSVDGFASDANLYDRTTEGSIDGYEFNISANVDDKVFLGVTVGVNDVDYFSYSRYTELGEVNYSDGSAESGVEYYTVYNTQHLSGYGVNVKFGAIFFPIDGSPFRIGIAGESPTFYHLDYTSAYSIDSPMYETDGEIYIGSDYYTYSDTRDKLRLRIKTPWKVRVSLGHTIGTYLAIGAEYEYANYGKTKQSYDDWDWEWGDNDAVDDYDMNALTKQTLQASHSFKLGLEFNITENLAVRAGYNYYSSMFEDNATLDVTNPSSAFNYVATTDYLNKGDVNIYTVGLGYHGKHLYADVAYKFRSQSGDFYAFDDTNIYTDDTGRLQPVNVDLDTHQVFFSLGYKF